MKKNYFFTLVSIAAMLLSINATAQYTLTKDDVTFDPTTGTITDYTNTTEKNIVIPSSLSISGTDSIVKAIGRVSFDVKGLTSVVIPSTVDSIFDQAFHDNSITSVTIPNSVNFIDFAAFNNNDINTVNGSASNGIFYARKADGSEDLTTIVSYGGAATVIDFIPNTVTTIGDFALMKGSISSITIPNSVTSIRQAAFYSNLLTSVSVPKSVTYIGHSAFSANFSLTSIDLPADVIGYKNEIWKTDNDSVVTKIENPNSNNFNYRVHGDKTYLVTFVDYDDTELDQQEVDSARAATAPADPTRDGYTFTDWDTPFDTVISDLTVKAEYEKNSSIANTSVKGLNLYPNPAANKLIIEGVVNETINIYNTAGVLLQQTIATTNKQEIDISTLSNGLYIVSVGNTTQKLTIIK